MLFFARKACTARRPSRTDLLTAHQIAVEYPAHVLRGHIAIEHRLRVDKHVGVLVVGTDAAEVGDDQTVVGLVSAVRPRRPAAQRRAAFGAAMRRLPRPTTACQRWWTRLPTKTAPRWRCGLRVVNCSSLPARLTRCADSRWIPQGRGVGDLRRSSCFSAIHARRLSAT